MTTSTMIAATARSFIPGFLNNSGVDFEIGADRITFSGDVATTEVIFDGVDFTVIYDGITMASFPEADRARRSLWGFLADACGVPF